LTRYHTGLACMQAGVTAQAHQHRVCSATAAHTAPLRPAHAPAAAPAHGSELGLPTNFGERFAEGALLGVGSFGTVHLATCRTTGREVAVKKLRKDLPRGLHLTRGTGRSVDFGVRLNHFPSTE
jgi:hypothetical protein